MDYKFNWHTDPGHGWVAVKRDLLVKLGIADKITTYSYQRGQTVYLEEDCDLSTLITALRGRGDSWTLVEKPTNRRSPIRSYEYYVAQ